MKSLLQQSNSYALPQLSQRSSINYSQPNLNVSKVNNQANLGHFQQSQASLQPVSQYQGGPTGIAPGGVGNHEQNVTNWRQDVINSRRMEKLKYEQNMVGGAGPISNMNKSMIESGQGQLLPSNHDMGGSIQNAQGIPPQNNQRYYNVSSSAVPTQHRYTNPYQGQEKTQLHGGMNINNSHSRVNNSFMSVQQSNLSPLNISGAAPHLQNGPHNTSFEAALNHNNNNHNTSQQILAQNASFNQNLQQQNPPLGLSPTQNDLRRHLPIKSKEKIFNEWGAVLKHQDEINQKQQQDEMMKIRLRQLKYKDALDSQMAVFHQKLDLEKREDMTVEQRTLEYRNKLEQEQIQKESQKKEMIRGLIKDKVHSSLQEKQRIEQEQRERAKMEQDRIRDGILAQLAQQRQQSVDEKQQKSAVASQYHNDLLLQEQLKREKQQRFKQDDVYFAQLEQHQLMKVDQSRQTYFDNLKKHQELNNANQQYLQNYLGNDTQAHAQRDEAQYLKAVREKAERDQAREEELSKQRLRTKNMNRAGLEQQMQQKVEIKKVNQFMDQRYADNVKSRVVWEKQQDEALRERQRWKQRAYMNELNTQIEDQTVKKKYDTLMTEHERRVNDKDIKAYEVQDNQTLHGKLPGFRSHEQDMQERYLEKVFTTNPMSQVQNNASPYSQGNQNASMIAYGGQSPPTNNNQQQQFSGVYQIKQQLVGGQASQIITNQLNSPLRGQSNNNRSTLQLGGQSMVTDSLNRSVDQQTLEEVRKNMEQPHALRFRNNTGNRSYGFDQTIHKQPPLANQIVHNDQSFAAYNYAVAGNHKH